MRPLFNFFTMESNATRFFLYDVFNFLFDFFLLYYVGAVRLASLYMEDKTRWQANPLTRLAPLGRAKGAAKGAAKEFRRRGPHRASFGFFLFFQNFTSPLGGSTQKSILRLPTDTRGWVPIT